MPGPLLVASGQVRGGDVLGVGREGVEEGGEGDAEAGGESVEDGGGGVGLATLDERDHGATDAGAFGQGVEGKAALVSKDSNPTGDAAVKVVLMVGWHPGNCPLYWNLSQAEWNCTAVWRIWVVFESLMNFD